MKINDTQFTKAKFTQASETRQRQFFMAFHSNNQTGAEDEDWLSYTNLVQNFIE